GARGTCAAVAVGAGRVGAEVAPEVCAFLKADDAELLPYDCEATLVHARRLQAAGLLTTEELSSVGQRLAEIAASPVLAEGEHEDVHSFIESELGDVGRKIHAGR